MDETKKSEPTTNNPMMKTDANGKDIYLPIILNSKKSKVETFQISKDEELHQEETRVSVENNETYKEYKEDEIGMAVNKTNMKISNRKSKKNSQLLANDKKESLKRTRSNCNKTKWKTTRKSSKIMQNMMTDEIPMTYKKIEAERYYKKPILPSFTSVRSNDTNNMPGKNNPYYGTTKQQELCQYSMNNSRNILQYLDDNNLRHANQQVIVPINNPWLMTQRSSQNFASNNITNTQNKVEQSSFINDGQYSTYVAADYNYAQNENLYSHSSINNIDPYKLLPMENKDYCTCNICTNYMWNNIYTTTECFPQTKATFLQTTNNFNASYTSPTTSTSNNFLNTTMRPFNSFHNYQSLQTDYYKQLLYKNFNTVNYAHNSECEMASIAKENITPQLNNWHHINRLTTSYNNNLNIPFNTSISSDTPPFEVSSASSTNAHFNNYYNRNIANMSMGQSRELSNFDSYTVPTFEDSFSAIDKLGFDSDQLTNITSQLLTQNCTVSTTTDCGISDITNFLSETANASEESSLCLYAKKKDYLSDVFDTIYRKDI